MRSEAATGLGPAYPSSSAARSTRSTVAGATLGEPAKASDAVDGDTPARAATVLSVARSAIAPPSDARSNRFDRVAPAEVK